MRPRAKNAGYSTGLSQLYATLGTLWCGRTDDHVTITSLPKYLGLIGYQICLAMVLRWRYELKAHGPSRNPIRKRYESLGGGVVKS